MTKSETTFRKLLLLPRSSIFAGCILFFALAGCFPSTPYNPSLAFPSATSSPATQPTNLPTEDTVPPTSTVTATGTAAFACMDSPTSPASPTVTVSPTATPPNESPVSFQAFRVQEGEVIALVNGRVIDGTGAPAWLNWTVLIQGERIIAAGPDVVIPDGARLLDLTGQTLLPGMFDMHGHLYAYDGRSLTAQFTTYPRLYLAGGVTTIFTAGELDPHGAILARESIQNGAAVGPQILTAGPYFSGGDSPSWMLHARDPQHMCSLYQNWRDKVDGVKFYTRIPEDQFIMLLNAAHADGLVATGHLESISGMRAIELGLDGIEHGLFSMSEFFPKGATFATQYCAISELDITDPAVTNIVDALVKQGTYLDPTIVVFQPELPDFKPLVADWEKYLDPGVVMPLRRELRRMVQTECLQEALEKQAQFVKAVHDRGGLIVTGTDPVIPILLPGYGLHRELQNLVEAGLSPLESIRAATLNAAIATRLDTQKGSIAVGKIADLVVVEGNPDEDITAIGNTRLVFKAGIPYLPDALRKSVEGQIGKEQ